MSIDVKLYVVTDTLSRVLMITTNPPDGSSGLVYEFDIRCGIVVAIRSGGVSYNYVRLASGKSIRSGCQFDANEILGV